MIFLRLLHQYVNLFSFCLMISHMAIFIPAHGGGCGNLHHCFSALVHPGLLSPHLSTVLKQKVQMFMLILLLTPSCLSSHRFLTIQAMHFVLSSPTFANVEYKSLANKLASASLSISQTFP